jgi:N-methylhydantoinase A/oxoprolinase/acetone carboxylase beta subunit
LGRVPESDLDCRVSLRRSIVAVGAPVEAYLPFSAQQLHTELVVPPNAHVGNALGAVVAGVVQQVRVVIRPPDEIGGPFRLHLPQGVYRAASIDDAVTYARKVMPDYLRDLMRQAGADGITIRESRQDVTAALDTGWGETAFVESELVFTAMGDPDLS